MDESSVDQYRQDESSVDESSVDESSVDESSGHGIFSFKKRKIVLIFVVEEKERHHCNPTVIWKICRYHFFKFRLSIIVTMT